MIQRFAMVGLAGPGRDQRRRHAARLGRAEIPSEVFEHRRAGRIDFVSAEERLVGEVGGLGDEPRRDDVESVLEQAIEPEPLQRAQRVIARAVGEDQLAPRQSLDLARQRRIGRERGAVDVVDEFEELVGARTTFSSTSPRSVVPWRR